jgi:hypothetical protein
VLTFYPTNDASRTVRVRIGRASPYFSTTDTTAAIGIPRVHHEYLAIKASQKVGIKISDSALSAIERDLVRWEGIDGAGGKIRDYYAKRDQQTVARLRAKVAVPK